MVASRCASGIGAAMTSSLTLTPSAALAGVDSESGSAVEIPRFESLLVISLLLMCGGGGGFRIAKNQFPEDSRTRPDREAAGPSPELPPTTTMRSRFSLAHDR